MTLDRRTLLAFFIATAFVGAVFFWMVRPPDVKPEQLSVLNMMLGALIGAFVTVIGFDFGSSAGSKSKDDALISAAQGQQQTNGQVTVTSPGPVEVTAPAPLPVEPVVVNAPQV